MSSSSSPLATIKSVNNSPAQTSSAPQSQSSSIAGSESHYPAQRRSGGSRSIGAGSANRSSLSSPRNNQSSRKPHKNQRKPRLADEDAMAESQAVMRSANSRKGQTSITHLMNFSLPPRPQNTHRGHYGHGSRRTAAWGLGSGYHAIDKARYVNANYRFIVDPRGDYSAQITHADIHLDWNLVLQILASARTQCSSCPICLSTPVAPRMAQCGHIFCLPCLIRYMHSTDATQPQPEKKSRWKKCPICWDSVYISESRPVRWFTGQEGEPPREGGDIVLRLMMRQPGSTLALPRDGADSLSRTEDIPWHFAAEVTDYARVMKGTEDYLQTQYDLEILELERQEREDELMFGEEAEWTRKAVKLIREAQENIKGIGNPPSPQRQPTATAERPKREPIKFHGDDQEVPEMYSIQHAAKSGQSGSSGGASTPLNRIPTSSSVSIQVESSTRQRPPMNALASSLAQTRSRAEGANNQNHESPYLFYQALVHYYLSPLDIRILKSAFGDYMLFPATILPRVEHISTGHIIDQDLRKRAKYLSHLPYGCEVCFLECDWTDVVSPEVLELFQPEIERRRKRNKDKEVREEKERLRAEKDEEEKRWAAARRKRPSIERESFMEEEFHPLAPPDAIHASSPDTSSSASPLRVQRGSAFASLASPPTSPAGPRTVWGTAAVMPGASTAPEPPRHDQDASDHDGWLQGWENDFQEDRVMPAAVAEASSGVSIHGTGKKKKAKAKKITLMSTNARRGA
ncbi:hypothetical protein FGG08_003675 [Glutinoglossum americanum]|uniref:RING-type domain-containing protein n=1 Tax=Glutinoglossum americanum TaxID=1670608 RepID=A0A9P8L392_9PEZI|nr:hypothetical protein FGG08_003675 [Glutinoglossum americanum]